jgi:uncharacterized Zn-binding protein involved in type VI secretion
MHKAAATVGDTANGDKTVQHAGTLSGQSVSPPCVFSATIDQKVSANVFFDKRAAATTDSTAAGSLTDVDPMPESPNPDKAEKATLNSGSGTVFVNNVAAVRDGDGVTACGGKTGGKVAVTQTSTVLIGG